LTLKLAKSQSSENKRRKVNITSWGFVKGRHQGWMPQLTKVKIVKSAST
jgi:hypothetical protein